MSTSELSFWFPLFLIFASAFLAGVIKRYIKDPCLKVFHRSFVFIKLKDGQWISGDLIVFSNSLELRYHDPTVLAGRYEELSYVLYEQNLDNIDRILRPSPHPHTTARREWELEIARLQNPSALRLAKRRLRNLFNMLRDAVAQAFVIIFGTVRQRTRLATVQIDDSKVGDLGKTLVSVVSNAYEPILELYLGHQVVVETTADGKVQEQSGVLQEYSSKYILARDVDLLPEVPPGVPTGVLEHEFDVVFPRQVNQVRHLAHKKPRGRTQEGTVFETAASAAQPPPPASTPLSAPPPIPTPPTVPPSPPAIASPTAGTPSGS